MGLRTYQKKRDFRRTTEPKGSVRKKSGHSFVIQKHAASRLHYDFRLEMDGVLKSWAVPKGPSVDPSNKRLAVQVEDHPLDYGGFEGTIPENEYGGGTVMLWDRGDWEPAEGDARKALEKGKLKFTLHGERLHGGWALVRMGGKKNEDGDNWLLIKEDDEEAQPGRAEQFLKKHSKSVATGRTMAEIEGADGADTKGKRSTATKKKSSAKRTAGKTARAADLGVAGVEGARKKAQPASFKPELATLVSETPAGDEWVHEVKFDGYRILAVVRNGSVKLLSRNGKDWTAKFAPIAKQLEKLKLPPAILDGEMVAVSDDGEMDFQALQNVVKRNTAENLTYYVFDLPYCDGYDLTAAPLVERKKVLQTLFDGIDTGRVRYCDHIRGSGSDVYEHACRMKLEGVISKRADSRYAQRRTKDWLKSKCLHRQEFVIGGFTAPGGSREHFGALLLGYFEDKDFIYCGKVGTGFDEAALKRIYGVLSKLEVQKPAFKNPPTGRDAKGVTWVSPKQLAEVEFTEWTDDGRLRHPTFRGLRSDKPAKSVVKEQPKVVPTADSGKNKAAASGSAKITGIEKEEIAGVRLTNPDRVLYPEQGITKRALAEYYESVKEWVLPHAIDRPLSIVRCPEGHTKECFYQKHRTQGMPDSIDTVTIKEKSATREYIVVHDLSGIIGLVQMGALEIHPWGCRVDNVDKPDRMVFDLDPDQGVSWNDVKVAALRVREVLEEAGLDSFLKTSGGKGLHVVVPLTRRSGWDEVKEFAQAVAKAIVRDEPKKYLATSSKARRKGKIFIDYLRNARGQTSVAAYSTRAREGATVSTPLRWEELAALESSRMYTVQNIGKRLASLKEDPWEDFTDLRQSITRKAWAALDSDPA